MTDEMKKQIEYIEIECSKGNLKAALDALDKFAKENPGEGVAFYELGRILSHYDDKAASICFDRALERGFDNARFRIAAGIVAAKMKEYLVAERHFNKVFEIENESKDVWAAYSMLASIYIKQKSYLKAEKIARKMISEFPTNYYGYHLFYTSAIKRGQYDDALSLLKRVPELFKENPKYLMDYADCYVIQNKYDELMAIIDSDERFNKVIPNIVLRHKFSALMKNNGSDEEKKSVIETLALKYVDGDALLALMLLNFCQKNYIGSYNLANHIMRLEKINHGDKYHIALYCQMFNVFLLSDRNPNDKAKEWINAAGHLCLAYSANINVPAIDKVVKEGVKTVFDQLGLTMPDK